MRRWVLELDPIKPEPNEVVLCLEYDPFRPFVPGDIVEDSGRVPSPLYILNRSKGMLYGGDENFEVWTAEPYPLP